MRPYTVLTSWGKLEHFLEWHKGYHDYRAYLKDFRILCHAEWWWDLFEWHLVSFSVACGSRDDLHMRLVRWTWLDKVFRVIASIVGDQLLAWLFDRIQLFEWRYHHVKCLFSFSVTELASTQCQSPLILLSISNEVILRGWLSACLSVSCTHCVCVVECSWSCVGGHVVWILWDVIDHRFDAVVDVVYVSQRTEHVAMLSDQRIVDLKSY